MHDELGAGPATDTFLTVPDRGNFGKNLESIINMKRFLSCFVFFYSVFFKFFNALFLRTSCKKDFLEPSNIYLILVTFGFIDLLKI